MNKSFMVGISIGMLITASFFGGFVSQASNSPEAGDAKKEEAPKHGEKKEGGEHAKPAGHGEEGSVAAEEEKPKVQYEYYPDVQSLDDLKDAGLAEVDATTGEKIVYRVPETCKEFSLYLETRSKKLDMYERDLKVREELLNKLQAQFDQNLGKYAATEARVRKLLNADPSNLKDNPEVAKMIKLYETLAAEDSAERLKNLDLDLTYAILKGMQPKKLSKIMAAMDPKLSAALSSRLVRGF